MSKPDDKQGKPVWRWAKRLLTLCFFILVPVLLFVLVKNLDWQEVSKALRGYSSGILLAAVGVSALSYAVYSSFDLIGRAYTKHGLPARQVLPLTFVCYAFTLNLSSWVGGVALRYRLYSRLGLKVSTITRVLSMSLITNWLGYILLAGALFTFGLLELPGSWSIGASGLRIIGLALLAVGIGYLLACQFSKRRTWSVRGHELTLPALPMALLQAALGALNWSLMALIIYLLLPEEAFYPMILGILMISSIAGVITHIPAGLGVIEAVFIALLQHLMPKGSIVAALIGYRAIYFLLPLAVACVVYLVLEKRAKKLRQSSNQETSTESTDPA